MDRLEQALAIYLQWLAEGSRSDPAQLLAQHADLHDLLEAMLTDRQELADADAAADALACAQGTGRIGEFRILAEIGRGGMGVVYRAHQASLDRDVALKVLPDHVTRHPTAVARFRREATTAARLVHPGIVPIHAVGSDGDVHWFAMELIEGASLGRVDPRTGQERSISACVELIASVADALEHAHRHGVIHRDVKPSNILMRPDGMPVLTDFGLARDLDQPGLTRSGAFAGTPYYVAPEQARGDAAPDGRTDVFSLGATLYELLTRQRPFRGTSAAAVLAEVEKADPLDPLRLVPQLSADVAAIVLKALEKDPARRYQSAAEFAADLRAFLDHRPILARRASTLTRLRRWGRREPFRAALAAALAIAIPTVSGSLGYLLANRSVIEVGTEEIRRQDRDERLARVTIDYEAGDFASARALADVVVAAAPGDVEARALRAIVLLAIGDGASVFTEFTDAHGADPALVDRARAYVLGVFGRDDEARAIEERIGEPQHAAELFLAGCLFAHRARRDAGDAVAWRQVHDLFERAIHVSPSPRLHYYVRWTDAALMTGEAAAVADSVHALRTLWPDSPAALLYTAFAARHSDPARAVADYRRVLAAGYDHPRIHRTIGDCLEKLGDLAGARAAREQATVSFDTREAAGRATLDDRVAHGLTLHALGERAQAIDVVRRTTELASTMPRARSVLGWLLESDGQLAPAAEQYRVAADLLPNDPYPVQRLGTVLLQAGVPDGAADAFARWTVIQPNDALAFHMLGNARTAMHDVPAAIAANQRAAALEPTRPEFHFNLAIALRAAKELRAARLACDAAIALRPEYGRALQLRGELELAAGDPAAASATFRDVTRLDPRSVAGWHQLGIALQGIADPGGARTAWERALTLEPSAGDRLAIEQLLAGLERARSPF